MTVESFWRSTRPRYMHQFIIGGPVKRTKLFADKRVFTSYRLVSRGRKEKGKKKEEKGVRPGNWVPSFNAAARRPPRLQRRANPPKYQLMRIVNASLSRVPSPTAAGAPGGAAGGPAANPPKHANKLNEPPATSPVRWAAPGSQDLKIRRVAEPWACKERRRRRSPAHVDVLVMAGRKGMLEHVRHWQTRDPRAHQHAQARPETPATPA